jgi:hypothetical protein
MVKLMNILHTLIDFIWERMAWPDPLRPDNHFKPVMRPEKKVYIPDPKDIKYPEDDITPPNVCPMNEGDMLCVHRSAKTSTIHLAAAELGYKLIGESHDGTTLERCHYQADYDHYPVAKNV